MPLSRLFPLIALLLCFGFTWSAPVPDYQNLDIVARGEEYDYHLVERSLDDLELWDRDVIAFEDLFPRHASEFSLRNVDVEATLVRRKNIFKKIKDGFKKMGKGIKNAAKKVGNGIKNAAKKVASGVKTAAKKVAKFGMQVISTAQSVAAKAVKFIPGIGTPLSAAMEAESKILGMAAKKIPVSLGKKLDKGMQVMDKIKNPIGGAAGAPLGAVLRRENVYVREYD